jgi:hypothetical protein
MRLTDTDTDWDLIKNMPDKMYIDETWATKPEKFSSTEPVYSYPKPTIISSQKYSYTSKINEQIEEYMKTDDYLVAKQLAAKLDAYFYKSNVISTTIVNFGEQQVREFAEQNVSQEYEVSTFIHDFGIHYERRGVHVGLYNKNTGSCLKLRTIHVFDDDDDICDIVFKGPDYEFPEFSIWFDLEDSDDEHYTDPMVIRKYPYQ